MNDIPAETNYPVQIKTPEVNFDKEFTISLDAAAKKESKEMDRDDRNQERMFQLRELFLQSPSGEKYKWVPYAIEAFARIQRSTWGPYIGTIEAINIDPQTKTVRILTEGDGNSNNGFEVSLDDLSNHSLEYQLDHIEQETPLEGPIPYSAAMQKEVAQLEGSIAHSWNLITRASRHIAAGRKNIGPLSMRVNAVGTSMLIGAPVGVGIYLDGKGGRSKWTAIKLRAHELPFTDHERNLLQLARNCHRPKDRQVAQFENLMAGIQNYAHEYLKRTQGDFHFKSKSAFKKWAASLRDKVLNMSPEYLLAQKLLDNSSANLGDHARKYIKLSDKVQIQVFEEKGTFSEKNPFECTELPEEMNEQLQQAYQELAEIVASLMELLQENSEIITSMLPEPEEVTGSKEHIREMQRKSVEQCRIKIRETLTQLPDLKEKTSKALEMKLKKEE
jgi:hypothetical protein